MSESGLFGSNLLCEFNNTAQEEYFSIERDIYIESQRSLRNDPSPNPNKIVRLTRSVYENYVTLMRNVKNLQQFLINYQETVRISAEKKRISGLMELTEEEQQLKEYLDNASQPLIINKIVLLKDRQEKQAISYAINKLKCMVLKARYKETTALEHLTETYIAKLKNALIYHVRYREDKSERNKLLQLETIRNEFILKAVEMIKKRYDVIELKKLNCYKIQPVSYLTRIKKGLLPEKPFFFINFFTESLLFIDSNYINFDQNILFCPLVHIEGKSMKISDDYLKVLNETANEWAKFQIYVEVYHIETNSKVPIFYSKLKEPKPNSLFVEKSFPERIREEIRRLQMLLDNIDSIRKCVFGRMILHWFETIFDQENKSIEIVIQQKFKVIIRGSTQTASYENDNNTDLVSQKPEILTNLIIVAGDRKNMQKGRKQLRESLRSQLEATIFKLVSEKVGHRVSWPLECNASGHYYYQYNSDRITNRGEVRKFFSQF